jgi:hypothetical protein
MDFPSFGVRRNSAAGNRSSAVPTSRTGLPAIFPLTWDDPYAREA